MAIHLLVCMLYGAKRCMGAKCLIAPLNVAGPQSPLTLGTWNVTSLVGKEPELMREVERYQKITRYAWTRIALALEQNPSRWPGLCLT